MSLISKLYGSAVIKPNHHYATHVVECTRNFGPLDDFWTFLFERLNKVLKSFKTNNHANGELETTFFTEFQRTCHIGRMVMVYFVILSQLTTIFHTFRLFLYSITARHHFHARLQKSC